MLIASGNWPSHIASSISDCLTNWIPSLLFFIKKWFWHKRVKRTYFLWREQISSNEFSYRKANCVLSLRGGSQGKDVLNDVKYHILTKSSCNLSKTFGCLLSNSCFFLSKSLDKHIDDFFKIVFIDIAVVRSIILNSFVIWISLSFSFTLDCKVSVGHHFGFRTSR